jgi:hypothetical protein
MSAADALGKFCLSLPGTREGLHFHKVAFFAGKQMFATWGDEEGVVVQLEPDHAQTLVEKDAHVQKYTRAPHCVMFHLEDVPGWKELVRESYALSQRKPKTKAKATAKAKKSRSRAP